MGLERHARRFLEMLSAAGQARGRYESAHDRRQALADLANLVDPPGTVEIGGMRDHLFATDGGLITLRVYSPLGAPARILPGIVFFHGGGWVAGSLETHDGLCRRLANQTGCRLIAVDYRLAPEFPFPSGLYDGFAAVRHIAANPKSFGIDAGRLGVAGDSAGGGMAAAICRLARDAGGPQLCFQLLLCPILDARGEADSRRELGEGYFLDRETMSRDLELYGASEQDFADPRLSPLRASEFGGLPPAYIHTAQFDPFADEGEAYARKLSEAGVAVHGRCHAGMIHFFYAMPRMIPYARPFAEIVGAEMRHAVSLPAERRAQNRVRPERISL